VRVDDYKPVASVASDSFVEWVHVLGQFAELSAVQLETECNESLVEVEKLFTAYDESLYVALCRCRRLWRVCLHWYMQNWKLHDRYESKLTHVRFYHRKNNS
jgi:hypothetical protein